MVSYYLLKHIMALNAILKNIIGGFTLILSFLVGRCEKIAHKSVNFHRIAPKIYLARIFESMNMYVKLQASPVSRFC